MSAYSCLDLKERVIFFTADDFGMCHSVNERSLICLKGMPFTLQ